MKNIMKKGEMQFWLVMTILVLASLVVILMIVFAAGGKLQEFLGWIGDIL